MLTRIAALALLATPIAALAEDDHVAELPGVRVLHVWTQADTGPTARIFAEIENTGASDIVLAGGGSDSGEAVLMAIDYAQGGEAVELGAFTLAAGEHIDLTPDGMYLVLDGLEEARAEGTSFEMHLDFADLGELEVTVEVEAEDATQHSHAGHDH